MINRFLLFLLLFHLSVYEAISNNELGSNTRETGVGGAGVATHGFGGLYYNQAGLADVNRIWFGINYRNNFLLKQLSYRSIGLVVPAKRGVVGFDYSGMGYSLFRKHETGISYSIRVSNQWAIGARASYYGLSIGQGYGKKGVLIAEVGMSFLLNDKLTFAFHLYNPNHQKIHKNELYVDRVSTIISLGFQYKASPKVTLLGQLDNSFDFGVQFKSGFEYNVTDPFYIRAGITTRPEIYSLGLGYVFKSLQVDLATAYHIDLGLTTQASLLYHFK